MFIYDKKLQYPVRIARPNPRLASIIISQYGGPDGELGASLRYLSQRYSMPFDELKGLLTDIGIEDYFWAFRKKVMRKFVFIQNGVFLRFPPGPFGPFPPSVLDLPRTKQQTLESVCVNFFETVKRAILRFESERGREQKAEIPLAKARRILSIVR